MKRILLLALAGAMLLSLASCKKEESDASSLAASSLPEASSISEAAPSSLGETASGMEPASSMAELLRTEGEFIAKDTTRYLDERAPRFELKQDGTFTMTVNTGEENEGGFTGSYELTAAGLTLTVEERIGSDFLGQNLKSLPFSRLGEDHFRYTGAPLGMTRAGDQFTRDGIPPLPDSVAQPSQPASDAASVADSGAVPTVAESQQESSR